MDLSPVQTIVVVMMENRSFDHLLGHLSLEGRNDVDGLIGDPAWLDKVANPNAGQRFAPFHMTEPFQALDADPPHERPQVANQLGLPAGGVFPLDGFVANYATAKGAASLTQANPPPVMGWFGPGEIPVTSFFADRFCVCDRWFAALPAGTQPNRLMAMSGQTAIEVNQSPLPSQDLVYDWLNRNGISWRVYHETLPFFTLMPRWIPEILAGEHFRPLKQLGQDIQDTPPDDLPQVIFIEPAYGDAPHLGETSDDHAPAAIAGGQKFLLEAYRDLSSLDSFWEGLVMVVTYDEHGGFFDHASPPAARTDPPAGAVWPPFETLGVRVPALVISPFVGPGSVCHEVFDHTSILKLIGERFGPGRGYSDDVDQRPVQSVSAALTALDHPWPAPVIPSLEDYLAEATPPSGQTPATVPDTEMQESFRDALDRLRGQPQPPDGRFDALLAAFPPRTGGAS